MFLTILVAGFERAFLYDVRTGSQIQTLEGIQTIPPATGSGDHEHVADSPGEHESPSPHDAEDQDMPLDSDEEPAMFKTYHSSSVKWIFDILDLRDKYSNIYCLAY